MRSGYGVCHSTSTAWRKFVHSWQLAVGSPLLDCQLPTADKPRRYFRRSVLEEISSNIIRHAYIELTPGELELRLRLYGERNVARLSDTGHVYIKTTEPVVWNPNDLVTLPESGMGLVIANAALDAVRYRRTRSGVNCWQLTKRFAVEERTRSVA